MSETEKILFKYFAGECTDTEKEVISKWREGNKEHEALFRKYTLIWQHSRINTNHIPDVSRAIQKIRSRTKQSGHIKELFYSFRRAAAILIAVIAVALCSYYATRKLRSDDLITKTSSGKREKIILPDQTIVWLSENSSISYPESFGKDARKVMLEGEAYLEVRKDPNKPFVITSRHSITQVLGTSFNVRSIPVEHQTTVTVNTGRVAFYALGSEHKQVILTPGYCGILKDGFDKAQKKQNINPNFLSWKTGMLTFDNTPLDRVTEDLSHHFNTKIILEAGLTRCRLTATFNNESLEEILEKLVLIHEAKVVSKNAAIIISGKSCE